MKRIFKQWFKAIQFKPSFWGIIFNPFYFSRKEIYNGIKLYAQHIKGRVLDVGCGNKPYQHLFNVSEYVGVDIEKSGHNHAGEDINIYYDGNKLPFDDNSFDSVVCFEVLEHVFNPDVFLSEINRVLKIGGNALFTVPFIWDEHEQPFDYARYSSFGLKSIFANHGFEVIQSKKTLTDLRLFFLLFNAYVYKVLYLKINNKFLKIIGAFFSLVLCSISNLVGQLVFKLFPVNDDLYFGNIFCLEKSRFF